MSTNDYGVSDPGYVLLAARYQVLEWKYRKLRKFIERLAGVDVSALPGSAAKAGFELYLTMARDILNEVKE